MQHWLNLNTFITLKHATVWLDGEATHTLLLSDGATYRAVNPGDPRQMEIAGWVGCPGDIVTYNFEHEFIHNFISEKMHDRESYVVGMAARGRKMSVAGGLFEERWCYHFHRYLNSVAPEVEPEWPAWRQEAWELLGRVPDRGAVAS